VILVKKPDGGTWFMIDYTPLNEVTIKNAYPMLNIREIVDRMRGARYFPVLRGARYCYKMDMSSAYWTVASGRRTRRKLRS
jgi:hypothetical protein